ncbi:MAG: aminotransferase class IV [Aquisalinus sp.]|nr:aminotransferase class IV [Aquisalinus sp.]
MPVWVNGKLHHDHERLIDSRDRGFLLGDGVFETILMRRGKPVFLVEHLERFRRAAEFFDIPLRYTDEDIENTIQKVLLSSEVDSQDCACRITLTRGLGQRGLIPPEKCKVEPTLLITISKIPPVAGEELKLSLSDVCRNEGSPSSRYKTIAYTDNILARQKALREGADDAVLCNNRGEIACATAANIFLILSGRKLVTPRCEAGILSGITRGVVLDTATSVFDETSEVVLTPADLSEGYILLTNSLIGIQSAHMFGHKKKMPREVNDLLIELRKLYVEKVNESIGA